MSQHLFCFFPFLLPINHQNQLLMMYLVLRLSVWGLISACLFWRLRAIALLAIAHLKSLHQIPCSQCVYFTGDYRLKCTVNPMVAMSETAIGCRDFRIQTDEKHHNHQISCSDCLVINKCSNIATKLKHPVTKPKSFTSDEDISFNRASLD